MDSGLGDQEASIGWIDRGQRAFRGSSRAADAGPVLTSTNVNGGTGLDAGRRLRAMDGLLRSLGDAFSNLIGGAFAAVAAAVQGLGTALANAVPGGIAGVAVGLVVIGLVAWLLLRR